MSLDIVVGGMYGSEAKGHATQRIIEKRLQEGARDIWNIRAGGPNAGHTGHDPEGHPWAFRQVPVGVLVDGPVNLEISAGSEIDPPVLMAEIQKCIEAGLLFDKRLVVHGEATLINDAHKEAEARLVESVGSTGKGIGAARAGRILRTAQRVKDDPNLVAALESYGVEIVDGGHGDWRGDCASVVIEGTQGYALGMHAGHYPKCTTSNCRAVDFLSMVGISPWDSRYVEALEDLLVWVVARVYPIRVAGNSGRMDNETSWEALGLPAEHTTVTKKVRRVGLPDWGLVRQAVVANGADRVRVALSMVDQIVPEVHGVPWSESDPRWHQAEESLAKIEAEVEAPISLVMSGPNTAAFREVS